MKLEVAMKYERLDTREHEERIEVTQKSPEERSVKVNLGMFSVSLLLLFADKLRHGNIAIINISSTFEGSMLLALKFFLKEPHYLEKNMLTLSYR